MIFYHYFILNSNMPYPSQLQTQNTERNSNLSQGCWLPRPLLDAQKYIKKWERGKSVQYFGLIIFQ
jgi:hypothetical protein